MTELGYPVHESLYHVGADGNPHLVGGRCRECGDHHFPPQPTCPYCSSDEIDEVELSDRGTLWSFTSVLRAPPGYRGPVPYGFGVVELPEQLRIVSRLTEADPGRLTIGQEMHLVLADLQTDEDGRVVQTYAFAPSSASESADDDTGGGADPGGER
jgi:uncharacterized OB-fold protein